MRALYHTPRVSCVADVRIRYMALMYCETPASILSPKMNEKIYYIHQPTPCTFHLDYIAVFPMMFKVFLLRFF